MRRMFLAFWLICVANIAPAQEIGPLQTILQTHSEEVVKPSRRSVGVVLDDLAAAAAPGTTTFLERWRDKEVWQTEAGRFAFAEGDGFVDVETGEALPGPATQSKPNGGVRREIDGALVQFQLSDSNLFRRRAAVETIASDGTADQLDPLAASLESETDPALLDRKMQVLRDLTARFGQTTQDRVAAITAIGESEIGVEARATLNRILATEPALGETAPDTGVARILAPGSEDLSRADAVARLVRAERLAAPLTPDARRDALVANVVDGKVGGFQVASLNTEIAREAAYDALAEAGTVPPAATTAEIDAALDAHVFWDAYVETDPAVTDAAETALARIERKVTLNRAADFTLDALSLASIYFLAAIGLAITFGVMRVINMAHGEFIMMGAYTGYVVQTIVPNYTLSLIVALPLAFAVTFAAGVAMERLVIRHLYHRPLETLLATFGISIALQQLAKNIFGTQARPLTAPGWLDGAWVMNDVVQIAYIRIAIFVLALVFLGLILFALNRTRLGLEVRAVTQNPGMAGSMGIDPDRINMLTFGLGSGIAGIAGVAIGLYAKVTSEMGADYIVQSFMTVVVGGVGNVWGTLAGATLIGGLQKGIEVLNPSNTLAAQTYMILFIILFIQFRPRGIVALKGRAAGA